MLRTLQLTQGLHACHGVCLHFSLSPAAAANAAAASTPGASFAAGAAQAAAFGPNAAAAVRGSLHFFFHEVSRKAARDQASCRQLHGMASLSGASSKHAVYSDMHSLQANANAAASNNAAAARATAAAAAGGWGRPVGAPPGCMPPCHAGPGRWPLWQAMH